MAEKSLLSHIVHYKFFEIKKRLKMTAVPMRATTFLISSMFYNIKFLFNFFFCRILKQKNTKSSEILFKNLFRLYYEHENLYYEMSTYITASIPLNYKILYIKLKKKIYSHGKICFLSFFSFSFFFFLRKYTKQMK